MSNARNSTVRHAVPGLVTKTDVEYSPPVHDDHRSPVDAAVTGQVTLRRLVVRCGGGDCPTVYETDRGTGMSQAKISKIETGAIHPSVEDVEHLARALGAPQEDVDRLTDQVEHSRDRMTDWRFGRDDPATWQREVAQLEAAATELHSF